MDRLARNGDAFVATAGDRRFTARQVVVAMSGFQKPRIPAFAGELSPDIRQITSFDYRNPSQLIDGPVLVVGTGNSGAEIALDLAPSHKVMLSGRDVGEVPFRIEGRLARMLIPFIFRVVFHRVLTIRTPVGRTVRRKMLTEGAPRVRTKRSDVVAAGVELVPRMVGVREGQPLLANGRAHDVNNVIWCTGYDAALSWIDMDVHGALEPKHEAGIVKAEPGLYFLGRMFLYAGSSAMVHGVSRDASRIADAIVRHAASSRRAAS